MKPAIETVVSRRATTIELAEVTAALVAFLVVSTPTMHDFWSTEDPVRDERETTDFSKNVVTDFPANVALVGGALVLLAVSGGS